MNRTYDSKQGRFTQVDPIGMGASSLGSPQTFNLYAYCGNDPINHTDPSGLFWGKLFGWIVKIFKWVLIAVTVAVVVLGMFASHGTLSPFLTSVLKVLTGVLSKIGNILSFASGAAEGGAAALNGLSALWAIAGVGSIANQFQTKGKPKKAKADCPPKNGSYVFFGNNQQMKTYEEALNMSEKTGKEQGGWVYQNSKGQLKSVLKDTTTQRDRALAIDCQPTALIQINQGRLKQ